MLDNSLAGKRLGSRLQLRQFDGERNAENVVVHATAARLKSAREYQCHKHCAEYDQQRIWSAAAFQKAAEHDAAHDEHATDGEDGHEGHDEH